MSFNISIPGFMKIKPKLPKTGPDGGPAPEGRANRKRGAKNKQGPKKAVLDLEDRGRIAQLFAHLQEKGANGEDIAALAITLAEYASSKKGRPGLMRQELKRIASSLDDKNKLIIRENIDPAVLIGAKNGIVFLEDILAVCASAPAPVTGGTEIIESVTVHQVVQPTVPVQAQLLQSFVMVSMPQTAMPPAPYIPQSVMPPAPYILIAVMPPAPHVLQTVTPPAPHVPVNVTDEAPSTAVVVNVPKEQSKRLAHNLIAAVLRGDDVAAAARALEDYCFSAHHSPGDRSRAMGDLIREAVDAVGSEGRLKLRSARLPENWKQTAALAMLSRLLAI